MNFTLSDLARFIEDAIEIRPSEELIEIYGDYYSPYYMFMSAAVYELRKIADDDRDELMIELGCDQGRGLASMAATYPEGIIIGIDHTYKVGLDRVLPLFPNITFLQRGSLPPPPEVTESGRKIALLHIDTEHSYAQAQAEFEAYKPYLADGAVVIFDDLHAQDDAVLHYFVSLPYPKIVDDRMHPSCGWGVLLYTGDE